MPSIFLSDRQLGPRGDSSAPSSGVHPFALFICAIVFLGASWVAVGLRIWTRARLIRSFSWDDGTIIVANVSGQRIVLISHAFLKRKSHCCPLL